MRSREASHAIVVHVPVSIEDHLVDEWDLESLGIVAKGGVDTGVRHLGFNGKPRASRMCHQEIHLVPCPVAQVVEIHVMPVDIAQIVDELQQM
jgi:hypothetical protein